MDAKKKDDPEKKMHDIQKKIDEVLTLLSMPVDRDRASEELESRKERHAKTRGDQELAFLRNSKYKNLAITKHSQANLELIESLQQVQKFEEYPRNLLKHLDTLTDKLLNVVQSLSKKRKRDDD